MIESGPSQLGDSNIQRTVMLLFHSKFILYIYNIQSKRQITFSKLFLYESRFMLLFSYNSRSNEVSGTVNVFALCLLFTVYIIIHSHK